MLDQAALALDHVADGEAGKARPGWLLLVLGEVVRPLPIASTATMQSRLGSSALPGPIQTSRR